MNNINNESGRSMIEMLGVLAIIGVLSVGGIAGYSKAMMQYKINKTADQITQIVGNVRTLFASQKSYSAIDGCNGGSSNKTLLKKAHVIPDEMWNADGTGIENAFGGRVEILTASKKKGAWDCKGFGIILYGIPEEACMSLATYDWGSGSSSGFTAIGVNAASPMGLSSYAELLQGKIGTNSAVAVPNGATVSVPMPVNVAATACQTGDNNQITIDFY